MIPGEHPGIMTGRAFVRYEMPSNRPESAQELSEQELHARIPKAPEQERPGRETAALVRGLRTFSFQERRSVLLLADAAVVLGTYVLTVGLFRLGAGFPLGFAALTVLTYLGAFWMLDLYHQPPFLSPLSESPSDRLVAHLKSGATLFRAALLATLVLATMSFWHREWYPVQPKALAIQALVDTWLLYLVRLAFYRIFNQTLGKKRVMVVGTSAVARDLDALNRQYAHLGYHILGYVDGDPPPRGTAPLNLVGLGAVADLPELVRRYDCDTLFLDRPATSRQAATMEAVASCVTLGTEIVSLCELHERHFGIVPLRAIDDAWFVHELSRTHRGLYVHLKRGMDLAVAACGLLLASPLMALVALAIRLDGPGPVLYSQVRVGERGRPFRIYKFRTMTTDAEASGAVWAQRNDPRITRTGGFLRKTRLDELPQLVNVLRGELSVVGPRPERPEFVSELARTIPFYDRRHMVRPGLTGWAQVRFRYGDSIEATFEKLQYDLYYLKNRSLLLDIEIILRTIWVVVLRKGAR